MKKKRIGFIGFLILIIIGVCGCNMNIMSIKKSKIIKYLEKKYDDSFEYVSAGRGGWPTNVEYYCVKKTGDTEEFEVQIWAGDMADNYLSLLYKEDVKEYLFNMVSNIYGEDVIVIPELRGIYLGKQQTSFSSVTDFLWYGIMEVTILVPISLVESKDSMIEELRQRFATDKINPRGTVFYLADDIFPEVKESNYADYLELPYLSMYGDFSMNREGDFKYMDWGVKE